MYRSAMIRQFLVLLGFLLASLTQGSELHATVVGYWNFDEASGQPVLDATANANHGTLGDNSGAEAFDPTRVAGFVGPGALQFAGAQSDRVNVPDSASLDFGGAGTTDAMTISAWVNATDFSGFRMIATKNPSGGSGANFPGNFEFRANQTTGILLFAYESEGATNNTANFASSTTALTAGTWQHVAVTLQEGGKVLFYINGTPAGETNMGTNFGRVNNNPLRIGVRADNNPFDGSMDEVAVYDHQVLPQQVFSLASKNSTPLNAAPALVANVNVQAASIHMDGVGAGRFPTRIVNGSGIIADNDFDLVDQHDNAGSTNWLSEASPATTNRWLKFDLNGLVTLDQVRIWNANEAAATNRGLTSVPVQTSLDGINWSTVGGGPAALLANGSAANTYDAIQSISLANTPARFVRFGNPADPVVNGGGDRFTLSEVQFFGARQAESKAQITGVTAAASTFLSSDGRTPTRAVDGSGLIADSDGDSVMGHSNNPVNAMWLSDGVEDETTAWIRFDLGSDQFVRDMLVWNYNESNVVAGLTNRGIKTANIKYATSSFTGSLSDPNNPNWLLLGSDVPFTRADGSLNYEGVDRFFFNTNLRHVLIQVTSNYGDNQYSGLSEVQFFVPEPGSMFLILAGCASLVRFRRRTAR